MLEDAAAGAAAQLASVLWTRTLYPWLRWAHQRRADIAPQAERVILWVLSDAPKRIPWARTSERRRRRRSGETGRNAIDLQRVRQWI